MVKITKHILIQILFLICTFNVGYCLNIEGIWIPDKIEWQSPDDEGLEEIRYADISIMQFLKDGTFKLFQYIVYPQTDGTLSVSYPEGGNIFKGKWEIIDNNILVNYHEVYRTIKIMRADGGVVETDFQKTYTIVTTENDIQKIKTDKDLFIKSERLTKESKEFFAKY